MKSEGKREKEKVPDSKAGFAEDVPIRLLHDSGCYFISLTHKWLERITHLPFPIGPIIGYVEHSVDGWTHPLTHALECHSLSILASIDDKVISLIDGCDPCSALQMKVILFQLRTQGPVGVSAYLWLKHEGALKEEIRKAVCLANKMPLINLVTPIFLSVLNPAGRAISDWLQKQGERRGVESTRFIESSLVILKQEARFEGRDVVGRACREAGLVIKMDAGDVQYEGQNVSSVHENEGSCEERGERAENVVNDDVLHDNEGRNVDDVLHTKEATHVEEVLVEEMEASMVEGIVEEEEAIAAERDVNLDKPGETTALSNIAEKGDDCLPDVLEMFESSWLLGTPAFPKKAPTVSQTKLSSSSGFSFRRAFFNG